MKVCIAMSGGVDSSVAAALLCEAGHDVVGVHMKLYDAPSPGEDGRGHCCGLDDAWDARRVAGRLGIPFFVMDLRAAFRRAVMDEFADTYLRGATPNPCIRCNGALKFQVLLRRAKALGATHLATGHYARIGEDGGLMAAADPEKDQSYFLFPIRREALANALFPLGDLTKPEVRAHARRLGLITADKPESQEICFIPDDDHARFVREHRPGIDGAGEIVDESGRVLGRHDGYWRYTVGQRRGLGIAIGRPVYVLRIEPATRRVVVGPPERLLHHGLLASGCNWFRRPEPGEPVLARVRHRGALHPCVLKFDGDFVQVRFRAPVRAASPGQAVVFYQDEAVLGGGWILSTSTETAP